MLRTTFIVLTIVTAVAMSTVAVAQTVRFSNGFETDTAGWDVFGGGFDATRVASGTNGITSRTGSWHAEVGAGTGPNLAAGLTAGNWGGYNDVPNCAATACGAGAVFPASGYRTETAVYLDVDGGFANDTRFDLSSAVNQPDGNFRRDFVFNCGFYNDNDGPGAGTNRFVCSASNNATRASAFPKNPAREPTAVASTSGWYLFRHSFYDDGTGVLAVDLTVFDPTGAVVKTWTLSDPTDVINTTVGGNRYGWFVFNEFSVLAFDDTSRTNGPFPAIPVPEPNAIVYLLYGLAGIALISMVRRRVARRS